MKISLAKAFAVLGAVFLQSLQKNEDSSPDFSKKGSITLEFDNTYAGSELVLGRANIKPTGETVTVKQIKYIISNIVLIKADGTQHAYPKGESYFIVDETNPASLSVMLKNIPAGNYAKIKFGVGVDREQFEKGAAGQGDFLAKAQAADLIWSWSAGYKFLAFEGSFTAAQASEEMPFMIHTGRAGSDYNYCDMTLDLPNVAELKPGSAAQITLVADICKITDGPNKIILADHNDMGMGAMIMGGASLPQVTANLGGMFQATAVKSKQ